MPFTLAHPALAVHLAKPLKQWGVLSALIIGSMVPDIAYFVPMNISRAQSHSLFGLLWFCIPVGLCCYFLYHRLLKGPLLALVPQYVLAKLGNCVTHYSGLPAKSLLAVMLSLLIGAFTHLVWDGFTHSDTHIADALPVLKMPLFSIGRFTVLFYSFLQIASSIVGVLLLMIWAWRWWRRADIQNLSLPWQFSTAQRILLCTALATLPVIAGITVGLSRVGIRKGAFAMETFSNAAIFTTLPIFTFLLLLYAVVCHVYRHLKL